MKAGTVQLGEEKARVRTSHQCAPDTPDGRE